MSHRIAAFEKLADHPMLGRDYSKLNKSELTLCREFILAHDQLSFGDFSLAVNRWGLDSERPKRHTLMWSLVMQSNNREEFS